MVSYTTIRLLFGFAAIFAFIFMLNGLPCLGDANETIRANNIQMFQDNRELLQSSKKISPSTSLRAKIEQMTLHAEQNGGAAELEKINIWGIFPNSMFELVESVGRRHIPTNSRQAEQGKQYIVRDGDTLWKIAGEQLGNGSRYKEISKLNADVLKDENDLTIGMQLILPNP